MTNDIPNTETTALTQDERTTKEEALANMKALTMKRKLFNALLPNPTLAVPPDLRTHAVALLSTRPTRGARILCYLLLDDQTIIQVGPPTPGTPIAHDYRWIYDLPLVHLT